MKSESQQLARNLIRSVLSQYKGLLWDEIKRNKRACFYTDDPADWTWYDGIGLEELKEIIDKVMGG